MTLATVPGDRASSRSGDLTVLGKIVGGAVSIADTRTPPNGTYYNYMEETGVGSTFQIKDDLHLIGGLRYYHLSNARLEGPVHNPSINGLQGYIGLMLRF